MTKTWPHPCKFVNNKILSQKPTVPFETVILIYIYSIYISHIADQLNLCHKLLPVENYHIT